MAEDIVLKEKTDSISVSKTSTGKYSWDIKIYTGDLMKAEVQDTLIEQIQLINDKLSRQFSSGGL